MQVALTIGYDDARVVGVEERKQLREHVGGVQIIFLEDEDDCVALLDTLQNELLRKSKHFVTSYEQLCSVTVR